MSRPTICRCCGASIIPHNKAPADPNICEGCTRFGLDDDEFKKLETAASKLGVTGADVFQALNRVHRLQSGPVPIPKVYTISVIDIKMEEIVERKRKALEKEEQDGQ